MSFLAAVSSSRRPQHGAIDYRRLNLSFFGILLLCCLEIRAIIFAVEEYRMDLLDIMLTRRSVRKYTAEPVSEDKLEKILQAGLLAPTNQNRKPCEFYVIRDKAVLKQLSKAKEMGAGMLSECNAAIAVFGDSNKADTWIEDCSIAMSYMTLMAVEQGVGCCWCQMHLRSSQLGTDAEVDVRKVLSVPEAYRIVGILALGMPEKEMKCHTMDDIDYSKVHM